MDAAPPPVGDVPQVETLTFEALANKTDFGSGGAGCSAAQLATLMVRGDGTAQLVTSGPGFVDHVNCTPGSSSDTWYLDGTADPGGQVVTFVSCNYGRFTAQGQISYAGGALQGEVSCFNSQGVKFITLVVGR